MNETQKNWKKAWENYEPTETDKIYRQPRKRPEWKTPKLPIIIGTIVILVGAATSIYRYNQRPTGISESTGLPEVVSNYESNKDGKIMADNINKIMTIFEGLGDRIGNIKDTELNAYSDNINKMDLSKEYDKVREQSILKLNKAKEVNALYIKIKKETSREEQKKLSKKFKDVQKEYNDIDIMKNLTEAFDKAGVKYERRADGGIIYHHKEG